MPQYYEDPNTGERHEIKKTHKFRNRVVFPVLGVGALVVILVSTTNHGGSSQQQPAAQTEQPTVQAPVNSTPVTHTSNLDVEGSGQAMVTVSGDPGSGTSSNTVDLPVHQKLNPGYASVIVTRSPSVESYTNGGHGDSGTVTCKITRDGQVVDQKTATGQFASVSCSKFE